MRIAWASLTSLQDEFTAYAEHIADHLDTVSRPDTELEFIGAPRGRGIAGNYRSFKIQDEVELVRQYIRLRHRDDVDALAIGSSFDSGLREAREVLSIPVLGYTETAVLVAHMLADRFAIVAGTDKFHPIFDELVRTYGLADRVTGIYSPSATDRYLEALGNAYEDDEARSALVDELSRLAEEAVEDGAELLIPGGGAIPTLVCHMEGVSDVHGVPIMDATAVMIRLAETMADLYGLNAIQTSRTRLYRSPPEDFLVELESVYDV